MAKNPTPTNDPAALAFSAVEDALKDPVSTRDKAANKASDGNRAAPGGGDGLGAADRTAQRGGPVAIAVRYPASKSPYSRRTGRWLAQSGSRCWSRWPGWPF